MFFPPADDILALDLGIKPVFPLSSGSPRDPETCVHMESLSGDTQRGAGKGSGERRRSPC